MRRFLLHFALILHFAAIITFCGVTDVYHVRGVSLIKFTYFDSLVFFYFDILSLIKKKNIFGSSVLFDFPASACFFLLSDRLYIAWGILCSDGVSWKGGTPLFGLDSSVALSREWVSES